MFRPRSPRRVFLTLSLGLAATAFAGGAVTANPSIAAAASPHRAAVIVDTGSDVHRVVITFTEDSITGIEALQRSGANPVIYTFGGQGGAVCRLFGVGRDAGPGCLGGQDGDNRYWAYFRAPAGTSSFKYSSGGAGSTRVHDGDVEGWKFGTGAAPEYVSLASLSPPPPTTPTTSAQSTGSAGSSGSTPGSTPSAAGQPSAGSPSSAALPVTGAAAASGASGTTGAAAAGNGSGTNTKHSKTSHGRGTDAAGRTVRAALASSADQSGGSSAWSLLWFAALLGAIVAAIFVARRMRLAPKRE